MGFPKHLIPLGDETLLERMVARLRPFCARVHLIGNGEIPRSLRRLPRIPDRLGIAGPLAGMTAAFKRHPRACWLFVACDLPLLSSDALEWLLAKRRVDRIAVLPRIRGGEPQPLFAVYEPAARELLERLALDSGNGPRDVAQSPEAATPIVPVKLERAWTNVNKPEDLRSISTRRLSR